MRLFTYISSTISNNANIKREWKEIKEYVWLNDEDPIIQEC